MPFLTSLNLFGVQNLAFLLFRLLSLSLLTGCLTLLLDYVWLLERAIHFSWFAK